MKYKVQRLENETSIELETLLGDILVSIGAPSDAKVTFTATTDMQSSMGKVISIDNSKTLVVDTVWNDKRQMIECTPVGELSLGDMAWVSEHLSLDGEMGVLASKKKSSFGDINFINLIWENKRARIDVLTGEVNTNG
jgi:hypothetical protein